MTTKKQLELNRGTKLGQIPDAIEGAYIVLLAQNAFLVSRPILAMGKGDDDLIFHLIILTITLINFFNIAAGWLSDRLIVYTSTNLFWDIVSLAVFFILVQALLDTYTDNYNNRYYVFILTSIIYVLISIINVVWNNIEIRNLENSQSNKKVRFQRILRRANILNYISLLFAILMGTAAVNPRYIWLPFIAFALWSINWLLVIVYYTWSSVRLK